jgi:hypothetical protein
MNLHACDIRYRKVQTTDLTMDGCAITPALGDANWEQVSAAAPLLLSPLAQIDLCGGMLHGDLNTRAVCLSRLVCRCGRPRLAGQPEPMPKQTRAMRPN